MFFVHCSQLADIYGKVFSVRLGSEKVVFACGYKMVKEAIVMQADNFVDRPQNAITERFYSGTTGVQISLRVLSNAVQKWHPLNDDRFLCMLVSRWSVHEQRR